MTMKMMMVIVQELKSLPVREFFSILIVSGHFVVAPHLNLLLKRLNATTRPNSRRPA